MPYGLARSSGASCNLVCTDLEELLARSGRRSQASGITGARAFVDGTFLQILEGSGDDVLDLMERIGRDPTHKGAKVFHAHEAVASAFASWNMACLSPGSSEVSARARLEGATTIAGVVSPLGLEPDRLPAVIISLLKVLAAP
jgi:hypothetical protein